MPTQLRLVLIVCLTALAFSVGCATAPAPVEPLSPEAQLVADLEAVEAPKTYPAPAEWQGYQIAQIPVEELAAVAEYMAYQENNLEGAIAMQQKAVNETNKGHYDLATYLAAHGDAEGAIYHLRVGAESESADVFWTTQDEAFKSVREHRLWPALLQHLTKSENLWIAKRLKRRVLVLPTNAKSGDELPLVVWLHGYGATPDLGETEKEVADLFGVAILGVSATESRGADRFVWSEDLDRDAAHINDAVKEFETQFKVKGRIGLYGFSQGALVAARVAASNADRYAGALVLSPGGDELEFPQGDLKSQVYHCSVNESEHEATYQMTEHVCGTAKAMGATMHAEVAEGNHGHTFPEDFSFRFQRWALESMKAELDTPVATFKGGEVGRVALLRELAAVQRRLANFGSNMSLSHLMSQIRPRVLKRLVHDALVAQRLEKVGLAVTMDEVDAELERHKREIPGGAEMFDNFLKRSEMTLDDLKDSIRKQLGVKAYLEKEKLYKEATKRETRAYYKNNLKEFEVDAKVSARHILISTSGNKALPDAEAKSKAEEIRKLASAKGADFAALAKEHSMGPSGPRGGDLGEFGRGRMVEAFEEAAFRLKAGQVSGLVKTQFGYHIIKVESHTKGKKQAFKEAEKDIEKKLNDSRLQEARTILMEKLWKEADVKILE